MYRLFADSTNLRRAKIHIKTAKPQRPENSMLLDMYFFFSILAYHCIINVFLVITERRKDLTAFHMKQM